MPPITLAARDGQLEVVHLLLDRAPPSERVLDDAISVAQMSVTGTQAIVDALHAARLRSVAPEEVGLHAAAERGDLAAVRAALDGGADVLAFDDRGMDALSWAALRGHAAVVELLLDRGAAIDRPNDVGWPAIGQASGQGHRAVVELLVARGADVNQAFDGGRTALMCAAYGGHAELVDVLVAAGADRAAVHEGLTAHDLAATQGHDEIAAMLA